MRWGICCVESLLMEPELQSTGAPERFWHRWFAWRPILITNRWRGRRLAWLQNVERRWTKGTTSGLGSRWIYRRMRAGGASDNAWSSRQANQNIAATTKTKTLNVKAPGLNIADPICEVGHNAPQARPRRLRSARLAQEAEGADGHIVCRPSSNHRRRVDLHADAMAPLRYCRACSCAASDNTFSDEGVSFR